MSNVTWLGTLLSDNPPVTELCPGPQVGQGSEGKVKQQCNVLLQV